MLFNQMNEVDLKLSLLSGSSVEIDRLSISPYSLNEIKDYGYSRYIQNLQLISLSVDDFINSVSDENKKKFLEDQRDTLRTFDFYVKLGGSEMLDSLLITLAMILKTDDIYVLEEGVVAIDFIELGVLVEDENGDYSIDDDRLDSLDESEIKIIHRENFDDIINVAKLQNYLDKPSELDEPEDNPANEETRKLMEQMKAMRDKVESKKKKQQTNEGKEIDISDIVSAVSSKSNSINKLNIWELTLYQLYDEYARLELIDNYDFSIRAMMAGAEKIDLKHWSSKL